MGAIFCWDEGIEVDATNLYGNFEGNFPKHNSFEGLLNYTPVN